MESGIKKFFLVVSLSFIAAFSFSLLDVPYAPTLSVLSLIVAFASVFWLMFKFIKSTFVLLAPKTLSVENIDNPITNKRKTTLNTVRLLVIVISSLFYIWAILYEHNSWKWVYNSSFNEPVHILRLPDWFWLVSSVLPFVIPIVVFLLIDIGISLFFKKTYLADFFRAIKLWFVGGGCVMLLFVTGVIISGVGSFRWSNLKDLLSIPFLIFWLISALVILTNYLAVRYFRAKKNNPMPWVVSLVDLLVMLPITALCLILASLGSMPIG